MARSPFSTKSGSARVLTGGTRSVVIGRDQTTSVKIAAKELNDGANGGKAKRVSTEVLCGENFEPVAVPQADGHASPFILSVDRVGVPTETRSPDPVVKRCQRHLTELRAGRLDVLNLTIAKQTTKSLEDYHQETHTVGAQQCSRDHGIERAPGETVSYVVVDDTTRPEKRVRLNFEASDAYDADFYESLVLRARKSVDAPLGWDQSTVVTPLRDTEALSLQAFE